METDSVTQHTYQLLCDIFDIEPTTSIKDSFKIFNQKLIQYQKDNVIKKPLVTEQLSKNEENTLININNVMFNDYKQRENLFKLRSEATLDSFRYSKAKHFKEAEYNNMLKAEESKGSLSIEKLTIPHILSTSEDSLQVEKISNGKISKNTDTSTKKYVMIEKPKDRGGRMKI